MIWMDGRYYGNIRMNTQETTVIIIRFHNSTIIFMYPEIGVIVCCNSSQEGIATVTADGQNMCYHGRYNSFAMSSCNTNREHFFRDQSKHLCSFQHRNSCMLQEAEFPEAFRNGRSIYHQLNISRNFAGIVIIMNGYPFAFQYMCKSCLI